MSPFVPANQEVLETMHKVLVGALACVAVVGLGGSNAMAYQGTDCSTPTIDCAPSLRSETTKSNDSADSSVKVVSTQTFRAGGSTVTVTTYSDGTCTVTTTTRTGDGQTNTTTTNTDSNGNHKTTTGSTGGAGSGSGK